MIGRDPFRLPAEARLGLLLGGEQPPGLTIAAAESCSGGRVADRITAVPGSSVYFLGSIVAYDNGAKERLLGVPREILESVGSVSEQCARAMAEGARAAFGADFAVATTGIAGPGGATARKPVGLVYVALAKPDGTVGHEHRFPGSRRDVVAAAAESALRLLVAAAEAALAGRVPRIEERGASGC
jgi:PncC family amidohydrolase